MLSNKALELAPLLLLRGTPIAQGARSLAKAQVQLPKIARNPFGFFKDLEFSASAGGLGHNSVLQRGYIGSGKSVPNGSHITDKLRLSDEVRRIWNKPDHRQAIDLHYEDLVRRVTGGQELIVNGKQFDAVTSSSVIEVKRTLSAIDNPKAFLSGGQRRQFRRTFEYANETGKQAEFCFKYGVHPKVRSYLENKGGVVRIGLDHHEKIIQQLETRGLGLR